MPTVDIECEARPGRVVLRLTRDGASSEYPLSAGGAEGLAETLQRAAERARDLE